MGTDGHSDGAARQVVVAIIDDQQLPAPTALVEAMWVPRAQTNHGHVGILLVFIDSRSIVS